MNLCNPSKCSCPLGMHVPKRCHVDFVYANVMFAVDAQMEVRMVSSKVLSKSSAESIF